MPVYCGSYVCGTAFFVSPNYLLTAGHVLAEFYLDEQATVAVIVEGEQKVCKVCFHQGIPDIAILECLEYNCPLDYVLPLLACKFKENIDLLIVGYPRELGNGIDYFGVTVKNSREKVDLKGGFDRMVVRTDSFGFNSYEGFSGSPVINDFGKVVGIDTDQLYYSLGYLSISSVRDYIFQYTGVNIEVNDALYDNTSYGLRTSYDHIRKHTGNKLKTRYNSKVHVTNDIIEKTIQRFCGYGFEKERLEIHQLYNVWHSKLAGERLNYVESQPILSRYLLDGLITKEVSYGISDLFYLHDRNVKLPADYKRELSQISRRINVWLRNKKVFEEERFMHVRGAAGCGKSHLLYKNALEITEKQRVYMLLGSEFSSLEDPVTTIARVMGWKDPDPFECLNNELENEGGKTATFIIDALNEGAGTHFWMEQLPVLKNRIERYSHLKLIVSLRKLADEDRLNEILRIDWYKLDLDGFPDRERAIRDYFDKYEIVAKVEPYTKIEEFSNPLFLRLFCETYYVLTQEEREKVLRLPIYARYLQKRNYEVSDGVDEDPKQDITSKFVLWVAQRSLEQYKCDDLPRQLAYRRSRKICPYRTWSKNLLKNCLDANLLREFSTADGDFVDFEFDSMGDFLKAERLLNRKCTDDDRFNTLLRVFKKFKDDHKADRNWQKTYNFIRAFLSVWNPPVNIWQKREFVNGELTSLLLSSTTKRNLRDDKNTLTPDIIKIILQNNPDYIDPDLILQNIELYSQGLMDEVHTQLMNLSMSERDLCWTIKVNGLFDGAYYADLIEGLNPTLQHEIEALLTVEIWMLSTSYPYLRAYIIRRIKGLMCSYPALVGKMIDKFYRVDDPYILEGLYAAVYGTVVSEDKAEYSKEISETIYTYHYGGNGIAPQDLMVRHWTLKIFELAYHQDKSIDVWEKAQPPYALIEDIFSVMPNDNYRGDGYFGDSYGGRRISHSLFHWDFSRYIIGTNSNIVSRVFYRDGNAVKLETIENAIAFLIKHRFGWNDDLGKYDADVPYQNGSENSIERIGKKYQWIGLYRVYAYLCDTCRMKVNIWSAKEKFADKNYPWYAPERSYFDPTLTDKDLALQASHQLFKIIRPASTMEINAKVWLNADDNMPQLYFIVRDRSNREWAVLQAYSTTKEEKDGEYREQFVYYNGAFASADEYDKLKNWAMRTNFYGRWMPEHSGSIDFRWNEYPWADSYRYLEDENPIFNEGGGEMRLAYEAQLQEYYTGLKDDYQFLTTAYMPCREMMEMFDWHTAERGIIRDAQGEIMAINREIPDEPLNALLVLRSKLDEFLTSKKYVLFWSLIGEKQYGNHPNALLQRLTGAAAYKPDEGLDIMQPMRKEPPPPKRERKILEKKDFPELSEETLDKLNKMDEEMMMRILSSGILDKIDKEGEEL